MLTGLRPRLYVIAALLLAAATGCNPNDVNTALDRYCDASGCVSANQLSANLDAALQNKVVGYISIVGLKVVQWGKARTSADQPSLNMDTGTPVDVASISKTLTAIAVLKSLAKNNLTIQSKIAPYLPPDWVKGPNVDQISFQQLLTHSAGFVTAPNDYAGLKQLIAAGVNLGAPPTYNNANFAIFRVLLPYMEKFNDPGPATRDSAVAKFYINYLRQNVFLPVGVSNADCNPAPNSHPILVYPFPPGNVHGNDGGDWTLTCGGGGWVLSASDLFKVLLDLTSGNVLLTDIQKAQMNGGCLGWDCSVQTQIDYVGKNGLLVKNVVNPGSGWELNTWWSIFKGKLGVVVITNSDPGANLNQIVPAAFQNAKVP